VEGDSIAAIRGESKTRAAAITGEVGRTENWQERHARQLRSSEKLMQFSMPWGETSKTGPPGGGCGGEGDGARG